MDQQSLEHSLASNTTITAVLSTPPNFMDIPFGESLGETVTRGDDGLDAFAASLDTPLSMELGLEPRDLDMDIAEPMEEESSDSSDEQPATSLKQFLDRPELRCRTRPYMLMKQAAAGPWIEFRSRAIHLHTAMSLRVDTQTRQVFINGNPLDGIILAVEDVAQLRGMHQLNVRSKSRCKSFGSLCGVRGTLTYRNPTTGAVIKLNAWRLSGATEWLVRKDAVEKKKKVLHCTKWIECDPRIAHTDLFNAMCASGFVGRSAHSIRVVRESDLIISLGWYKVLM